MDFFDVVAELLIFFLVILLCKTIFNLPRPLEHLENNLKQKLEAAKKELAEDREANANL